MSEQCFLVKAAGDIVRKDGCDQEYKIVAIKGHLAWVEGQDVHVNSLEDLDSLTWVRSGIEHEFTPGELIELACCHNPILDEMPWKEVEA